MYRFAYHASSQNTGSKVYHCSFWMGKFHGPTPKRHRIWSPCYTLVDQIQQKAGHMLKTEMATFTTKLCVVYTDALGVKRRVGKKKELKASQNLGLECRSVLSLEQSSKDVSLRTQTCLAQDLSSPVW